MIMGRTFCGGSPEPNAEILRGVYPEPHDEILHFVQDDREAKDDKPANGSG